eukprot:313987_1
MAQVIIWFIGMLFICFRVNIAGQKESCDTSCWCEAADVVDDWCHDTCWVDCGTKIEEACDAFVSAYPDTLIFAMEAFKKAKGNLTTFEHLINSTLEPYFEGKQKGCLGGGCSNYCFTAVAASFIILFMN